MSDEKFFALCALIAFVSMVAGIVATEAMKTL